MSTLNEIAANHARMAKAREAQAQELSERPLQIVGGFEMPCTEKEQSMPMHLMTGVQDNPLVRAVGF